MKKIVLIISGIVIIIFATTSLTLLLSLRATTANTLGYQDAQEYSKKQGGEALIIYETKKDQIVLEDYHNGHSDSDPHIVYSGTKSFIGVALTMLIEQDYKPEILNPLGIDIDQWERNSDGRPKLDADSYMTAQEWLEFGKFVYYTIEKDEHTLIDPGIMKQLIESQPGTQDYGITFWLKPNPDVNPDNVDLNDIISSISGNYRYKGEFYAAARAQDQRLMFLPDENLIVVRIAQRQRLYSDNEMIKRIMQ